MEHMTMIILERQQMTSLEPQKLVVELIFLLV